MKVFQLDVKVAATAYIVAEDEAEARKIAERELTNTSEELLEESAGGLIRGASYETLIEEVEEDQFAPRATLSPAITIEGPFDINQIEEVA